MSPRIVVFLLALAVACAPLSTVFAQADRFEPRQLVFLKNGRVLAGRIAWETDDELQLVTKSCKVLVAKKDIVRIEAVRAQEADPKATTGGKPDPGARQPALAGKPAPDPGAASAQGKGAALDVLGGLLGAIAGGTDASSSHPAPAAAAKADEGAPDVAPDAAGVRWVKYVRGGPSGEKLGCGSAVTRSTEDGGCVVNVRRSECTPTGELRVRRDASYEFDAKGRVQSMDQSLETARMDFRVQCNVAGDKLVWKRIGPGKTESEGSIEWNPQAVPVNVVTDVLVRRGVVRPGLQTRLSVFEPMSQRMGVADVKATKGDKPGLVLLTVRSGFPKAPAVEERTVLRSPGPGETPEVVGWSSSQNPDIRAVVTTRQDAISGVGSDFHRPERPVAAADAPPGDYSKFP